MRLGLKHKLVFSYVAVAALLVLSSFAVAHYFVAKQLHVYMAHKQDMKNEEVVNLVLRSYGDEGASPDQVFLNTLGQNLLEQGIILMLTDNNSQVLYCISASGGPGCVHTLQGNNARCPEFEGTYSERGFEISRNGKRLGTVWLGYHDLFYYSESEHNFVKALRRAFFIAALAFLGFSVLVGLFMGSRIANPIARIGERTRRIAEGEYGERVGLRSGILEIDALASNVDLLSENLGTQLMLKKRMADAYSHEFRTPLAALQSNLEAMIDGLWEPTRDRLQSLYDEVLRFSRMTSEIDALVQVRNGGNVLSKNVFELSDLVGRVLGSYEADIRSKGLRLNYLKEPCEAWGEPDKIRQVVINLLSNALKYTDCGGHITIRARNEGTQTLLYVEDDGVGIPPEDIPHIFEHLYRADVSRARASGGNGVGLSVVKTIVDAHGGSIDVTSRPGGGCVFVVALPLP